MIRCCIADEIGELHELRLIVVHIFKISISHALLLVGPQVPLQYSGRTRMLMEIGHVNHLPYAKTCARLSSGKPTWPKG